MIATPGVSYLMELAWAFGSTLMVAVSIGGLLGYFDFTPTFAYIIFPILTLVVIAGWRRFQVRSRNDLDQPR